jgi:putative heme iron utilization protein
MATAPDERATTAWQARCLLRAARAGTLATSAGGQPFAALVTPATAPDLSLLLWLSALSEHTRHLAAEPRCAVLVTGLPETATRLSVTGLAERIDDAALKARWLAIHPYASLYADFADFALWRIRPVAALSVAGFARATRLRQAELLPDPAAVARIAAAADDIISHCNADHAAAMAELAGGEGDWRMVAVDVDGCDIAQGDTVRRIAWRRPAESPDGVRAELIAALRATRLP